MENSKIDKIDDSLKNPVQFRLKLVGNMAIRFNSIKNKYGLESNADLVRLLITMEFERIQESNVKTHL